MRLTNLASTTKNETPDEKRLRSMNIWYFILIGFVCLWIGGAYLYLVKKEATPTPPPTITLDVGGGINMSHFSIVTNSPAFVNTMAQENKLFTEKPAFTLGEIVMVRYFYVAAVVLERHGDQYLVVYKDRNGALNKILLPKPMLLCPKDNVLNPVPMLVN